ncbi:hypothetical protein CERZMDRAFT_99383 [Cercospora zeae-maydis SCOH1-5]|uniref:Uncharacterized protein n=1 Tax=Cercospora zeae-maydis SCOH1-5 TaxID=717836 RepID=A0A6A6FA98_9PEZI|nr:hypothetical protein CERZMDRAFT_99383 [Cercospora zeae-maydis SCOH1-5]
MDESPTKRRKLSDSPGGGAVVLTAPLRPRVTLISPPSTSSDESKDEAQQPVTTVVESSACLYPENECFDYSNDKRDVNKSHPHSSTCRHLECADESRHAGFRLHLQDPAAELRRWLLNRNTPLDGTQHDRKDEARQLEREREYPTRELRQALIFAVQQAVLCHLSIESMREYLSRYPYRFWFRNGPADGADDPSTFPDDDRIALMNKRELWSWFRLFATELDFLRHWEEHMWQTILEQKWSEALEGNVGEIQELMRLGFVDKDMVAAHCGVPDD